MRAETNDTLLLGRHKHMLTQLREHGICNQKLLSAFEKIPRYWFVEPAFQGRAHDTQLALPIEHQQTISQPYIVARMTEALLKDGILKSPIKLLEVGTGSGYQTAILSVLVSGTIISLERIAALHYSARSKLLHIRTQLHTTPRLVLADGYQGYAQAAPFDAIIVTAACIDKIPMQLTEQLRTGGSIVAPIHKGKRQWLMKGIKTREGKLALEKLEEVVFVPMLQGVVQVG